MTTSPAHNPESEPLSANDNLNQAGETELGILFNLSVVMLCIVDVDGHFQRVSVGFEANLGWSAEALMTKSYFDFVHADDQQLAQANLQRLTADSPTVQFDHRFQTKEGDYKWLSWSVQLADDSLLYATAQDITARKLAEMQYHEQEERTRLILEASLDALISIDIEGRITEWNRQAEAIFGWSQAEAVGTLLSDTIIPAQYREAHKAGLARYLKTGEGPILSKRVEIQGLRRQGA